MPQATARFALAVLNDVRDKIFSEPDILDTAEKAYRQLLADHVFNDTHNTSTAAIEKLIDDIPKLGYVDFLQDHLRDQNVNLLAFLFARLSHARRYLSGQPDSLLPVEDQPDIVLRWALLDLWRATVDSSDKQ